MRAWPAAPALDGTCAVNLSCRAHFRIHTSQVHFCTLAACAASWFRPGGLICDWWAAVNIHIHIPESQSALALPTDSISLTGILYLALLGAGFCYRLSCFTFPESSLSTLSDHAAGWASRRTPTACRLIWEFNGIHPDVGGAYGGSKRHRTRHKEAEAVRSPVSHVGHCAAGPCQVHPEAGGHLLIAAAAWWFFPQMGRTRCAVASGKRVGVWSVLEGACHPLGSVSARLRGKGAWWSRDYSGVRHFLRSCPAACDRCDLAASLPGHA